MYFAFLIYVVCVCVSDLSRCLRRRLPRPTGAQPNERTAHGGVSAQPPAKPRAFPRVCVATHLERPCKRRRGRRPPIALHADHDGPPRRGRNWVDRARRLAAVHFRWCVRHPCRAVDKDKPNSWRVLDIAHRALLAKYRNHVTVEYSDFAESLS